MLRSLQGSERRALHKFLHSPYHNSRADVRLLFDYLTAQQVRLEDLSDRKAVFQAVYGRGKYDSKKLNYVVSYLNKLLESFIAQEEYRQREQEQSIDLLRGFRKRHWLQLSERTTKSVSKRLQKHDQRNSEYHRYRYHLSNESIRARAQQGRNLNYDPDSLNEAHEKAFFIEKLQLGCMIQSLQAVASKAYDAGFLPVVLAFLKDHPWLEEPVLGAWYHGFFVQTDANATEHFENLKRLMFEHGSLFSESERHDLFLIAVNFSIRRINSGDAAFSRDLFELYREGLKQDVFLENGVISRWSYNNIVNSALKMKEIAWAMQFLETNRARLEPAYRDTSYYFNLARCLYENGQLAPALESLTRMEYDDVLQNLSAKTLQIKIFYDMGSWMALDSLLDSVHIYIRRKKVLGYHKENFSNILRYMQRFITLPPGDRAARQQLKKEVESCRVLTEKGWFLGKLNAT